MLVVAKKNNKPESEPEPSEEGRERVGDNLNVWLPEELVEAFNAYRKKTRRTKTAEATVMMEEYLASHGFWPPQRDSGKK